MSILRASSLLLISLLLAIACTTPSSEGAPADAPITPADGDDPAVFAPVSASPEHAWLEQLVGEWHVTSESDMGEGVEPMHMESTETVRRIGDLWVQSEVSGDMGGAAMTAQMTLGYDPARKAYVGTWIDSMQPVLWVYEGHLQDDGRTLVLEAEGPDWTDPTITRRYRDAVTIVAPGHRRLTSSIQGDDGTWTVIMRGESKRIGG